VIGAAVAGLAVLVVALAAALVDERRRHMAALAWSAQQEALARNELVDVRRELRDAQERLLHAKQQGELIPPSEIPSPFTSPRDESPLDPIFTDWLAQYSGDARTKYERLIRARLGHGTPLEILHELEVRRDPLMHDT
jgi:hypothetical protein